MDMDAYTTYLPTLILAIARIAGIFIVAPVFGSSVIPARLRGFMSVVIALAVVGRLSGPAELPQHWLELAILLGSEVAIGATIGFTAAVVLAGVELGAVHIGQQMGVALAEVFNPQAGEGSGLMRRALGLLAVVIFLAIGGHRALIAATLRTFDTVPPGGFAGGQAVLNMVVAVLAASFTLALKVAAPVLVALLLATVALGLLQKTIPQCNILSIGLGVRAMLGLVVLAAALAAIAQPIEAAWEFVLRQLPQFGEIVQ